MAFQLTLTRRQTGWAALLLVTVMAWFALPAALRHRLVPVAYAANFSVTNTNDDGPGSLRQAIVTSNLNQGASANVITFNIPGSGVHTIDLLSPLPVITAPVTIDALPQSPPFSSIPQVELNGSGAGALANGLTVTAGHCIIRGLAISRFGGAGIKLQANGGNLIDFTYVGTHADGSPSQGNAVGVEIDSTSPGNTLTNNILSGNTGEGLRISSSANKVQGNTIGADGIHAPGVPGNGGDGLVLSGANNNTIGATSTFFAGNRIMGNGGHGIRLQGTSSGNMIQDNSIGTDDITPGNNGHGVFVTDSASNNVIGGPDPNSGNFDTRNIIVRNHENGVVLAGGSGNTVQRNWIFQNSTGGVQVNTGVSSAILENLIQQNSGPGVSVGSGATGVSILRNAMFGNSGLGIDLLPLGVTANDSCDVDTGANNLQNFPILSSARGQTSAPGYVEIKGTLNSGPNTTFNVQFFSADDFSGNGEGERFLGSAEVFTGIDCNTTFTVALPTAQTFAVNTITATATDPAGNTSEFSNNIVIANPGSLGLNARAYSVNEQAGSVTVTVNRISGSDGAVTVDYRAFDGSARAGQDYAATNGTLTFANGETSKTFTVPILDDSLAEGAEDLVIRLSNPTNQAVLTPGFVSARLVIFDNESQSPPTIIALDVSQSLYSFNSELPEETRPLIHLNGLPSGVTIRAIGYRPLNGQLYGLGSDNRLYTINLNNGNASPVATVPFSPSLQGSPLGFHFNPVTDRIRVTTGSGQNLQLNPDSGQVSSVNEPLAFAAGDSNAGQAPALVALANTNNFTGATSTTTYGIHFPGNPFSDLIRLVTLGSAGGSPVSPNAGQIFTVGQPAEFGDNVYGFDIAENGTGFLVLSAVEGGVTFVRKLFASGGSLDAPIIVNGLGVAPTIGSIAVVPAQRLQLSANLYSVNENSGTATITVRRSGGNAGDIFVDYSTSAGTATAGQDYTATSGTLTFADGETKKTFVVPLTDDALIEGVESVNVTLSNARFSNGNPRPELGPQTAAIIAIMDEATEPGTTPIDNADFFVRQHYADFLSRQPDSSGLAFWTNHITQCFNDQACINDRRIGTSAAFFIENEFQQTGFFIYRFYQAALGRRPTFAEFNADRGQVVGGANLENGKQAFATEFVQRQAFTQKYPLSMDGPAFVDAVITTAGQASGVLDLSTRRADLLAQYNLGANQTDSRVRVVRALIEDSAFSAALYNPAFVLMQYFGYLRRPPDQTGYNFWLDHLNNRNPNNYRAMVCAFITSHEYQRRFSTIITRSNQDCAQ